jgi:hypothetical protein
MAKLLKPRGEVKKAIAARIRAGKDLGAKAEIAESTGGYEDWLFISLSGAKRQRPSSPHSMRKERSGGHSLLLRRQVSTHPRASLFHIGKEHSNQGFFGWTN